MRSDPEAVGQAITLNNESYTVIGITPPDFRFTAFGRAELWTTLQIQPPRSRPPYYLRVIGRLKPDASLQQAQAEFSAITNQVQQQYPNSTPQSALIEPLKQSIVGDSQLALSVLLGAVLFVLLIASVNVANLLLARAAEREKEMAVRVALGASRSRLIRQALTESCLLALLGGGLGWLLASNGLDLIVALTPGNLPRLDEVNLDLRVLGFTTLITLLSGLLFGLAPALQATKVDLLTALKEGGRNLSEGFGRRRLRNMLVVSQVALALVLLVGAGLMVRSFLQLQRVDPGFKPDRVLTAMIVLPRNGYGEASRVAQFHQQLLERVKSLPGVQAASVSMSLPPNLLMMTNPFTVEGQTPAPGESLPLAEHLLISPDFFRTLGIRLKAGRPFTDADGQDAPQVIIINDTMARRYFSGQDPIGRRIQTGDYDPSDSGAIVVGVVDDVKYSGLNEAPNPTIYTPFMKSLWWRSMYLAVRTDADPMVLVPSVRDEIWAIDRNLPVTRIKSMDQLMAESVTEPRAYTLLLGLFAAVALMLAAIGIYGVMSYMVAQRTHEIGIRMALGAERRSVLKLVVGQGMKLALVGVAAGLAGAFALTWVMKSLLFGVSATDPATFAAIPLVLAIVALLACYLPARRATKVDPLVALRYE
jgi:putative ABC transport system permease protein